MHRSTISFVLLLAANSVVVAEELPGQGRLVALQAGDVACYADIEVKGEVQNLMAGFHVCEQEALIGKNVRLGWEEANVLAADCEGDMDCGRSDTVQLIDRIIAEPARAACAAGEEMTFTCLIGNKQLSVCLGAGEEGGWLQYRFGRVGHAPELSLPSQPTAPAKAAEGRVEMYSGGGSSWLRFANGDHAYVVYTGIGRWGEGGATMSLSGVVVEERGERLASLICDDEVQSNLDAAWYTRVGVTAAENSVFEVPNEAQ